MKKAMTKRFLALVLALALCTALMLPGFAATVEENSAHIGYRHSWVTGPLSREVYNGGERTSAYHMVDGCYYYKCSECGTVDYSSDHFVSTYPKSHSLPCGVCGYRL